MRGYRSGWLAVLAVGVVTGFGCTRPAQSEPEPERPAAATDEEARAKAEEIEAAVRSGDRARAVQAFALEVVAYHEAAALPLAPDRRDTVLKLAASKVDTIELVDLFIGKPGAVSDFRLLRVDRKGDRHHAVFRLMQPPLALMYIDVTLARYPVGAVGVEELVNLVNGVRATEAARQIVLPVAALRDPGLEARLTPEDRTLLKGAATVNDLDRAKVQRRPKEVLAKYAALPPDLKERLAFRMEKARALLQVGKLTEQSAALADLRERFPGDPAVDLYALDFHLQHAEYKLAVADLAAIRAVVGADPMLDATEALALSGMKRHAEARAAADRAVAADPKLLAAYACQITVAMQVGDHARVLECLKRAVEQTGHKFGDLRSIPVYASFVQSPQYREWLAWQSGRG